MSLFYPVTIVCPNCSEAITTTRVGSINADRRPDYRDAILNDKFQDLTCGACNETFRQPPEFNYLDAGRGQWIAAMPAHRIQDHREIESDVREVFDESYGDKAPAAAQEVGKALTMRLTFGWPAVREKLLLREHDLDDVVVEMLKMHALRALPSAPLSPGVEMRVYEVTDEFLSIMWLETASEALVEQFSAPRALYDAIAGNTEGWAKIRARLEDSAFVDMQKTLFAPAPEPEPA